MLQLFYIKLYCHLKNRLGFKAIQLQKNFSFFIGKKLDFLFDPCYNMHVAYLGVAQLGRALPWGGRGRGFKSRHSDQHTKVRKA